MKKNLLTFALAVLTIAGATKTANAETPNVPTGGWNSGAESYQPWSKSNRSDAFYIKGDDIQDLTGEGAYADWGVYNAISNGGNEPGLWRTLTAEEWRYLLRNTRWTAVDVQPMDDA